MIVYKVVDYAMEDRVVKVFESFVLGKCRCGCNKDINLRNRQGKFGKFFKNHTYVLKGDKHPRWKDGTYINEHGYRMIWKPNYPRARKNYIFEHIFVYQEYYKCCICKWGRINHKDKNPLNNEISNLELTTQSKHAKFHYYNGDLNLKYYKGKQQITIR